MHLSGFGGILQVDGYGMPQGAGRQGPGEARVLLGARAAKFFEIPGATPAPIAAEALARIEKKPSTPSSAKSAA